MRTTSLLNVNYINNITVNIIKHYKDYYLVIINMFIVFLYRSNNQNKLVITTQSDVRSDININDKSNYRHETLTRLPI